MYSLEQGSFFGEINILFGLYSEQYYKALTSNAMVFKIHAEKFMTLICGDHKAFENLFWIAVQRYRYNNLVKCVNDFKRERATRNEDDK
jgi:CRP-like cAMP-binding protein